jgi:hypothetical protein
MIYNMNNIFNREFQACLELNLIQVIINLMLLIRFISIANMIQITLMLVIHER